VKGRETLTGVTGPYITKYYQLITLFRQPTNSRTSYLFT